MRGVQTDGFLVVEQKKALAPELAAAARENDLLRLEVKCCWCSWRAWVGGVDVGVRADGYCRFLDLVVMWLGLCSCRLITIDPKWRNCAAI